MGSWSKGKKHAHLTFELNEDVLLDLIGSEDVDVNEVTGDIEVDLIIEGKTYYDPGCWYMPNGDPGNPPEYEEDFPIDQDDETQIQKMIGDLFTVTLHVDDEVEQEDEF